MSARDSLAAGWRVLARHLRYVRDDPKRIGSIAWRAGQVVASGELGGVLRRHTVAADFAPNYREWVAARAPVLAARREGLEAIAARTAPLRFHVVIPMKGASRPGLERTLRSLVAQSFPSWTACIACDGVLEGPGSAWIVEVAAADPRITMRFGRPGSAVPALATCALDGVACDFVTLVEPHDTLDADALLECAARVAEAPSIELLYADEDAMDEDGVRSDPRFKPGFDREWLLGRDFVGDPLVLRADVARRVLAKLDARGADWRLDLLLRLDEALADDEIAHLPRVLYHRDAALVAEQGELADPLATLEAREAAVDASLRRRGSAATVAVDAGELHIAWPLPAPYPRATIVMPLRDRADLLAQCAAGLRDVTDYDNWNAVLVDNGSVEAGTLELLEVLAADRRFRIVRDAREFNYAALCNGGVAEADGDVVVLLNNDVVPLEGGWLRELVSHAIRPQIGLVGATLYYPDLTFQHAGVILWLNGVADRPYIGAPRGYAGLDGRLASPHTVTAMVTACAALRREVYLEVGGMDPSLAIGCNDLDLCLRVAARGLRNIVTPWAELIHYESASRGYRYRSQASLQVLADEARFRDRWHSRVPADPMYNPNLTLAGTAYTLGNPLGEPGAAKPAQAGG